MIGQKFVQRSLANQMRFGAMTQTSMRGFAGGSSQPLIDPNCTDFYIVFVGKYSQAQAGSSF